MSRPVTPAITVDVIIEMTEQPGSPIVLIERKYVPFGWAIPGGFVDVGERLEQAAIREMKEETCLDVKLLTLLGLYSDPARDARGHTVTAVYIGQASGQPVAADDAANIGVFLPDVLPAKLAFDHDKILQDYVRYRKTGAVAALHQDN